MPGSINEICVQNLGELIEALTPKEPDPKSGRLRTAAIYRGMRNPSSKLLTGLDRLGMPEVKPHAKANLEEHLVRNFMRYSRPHLPTEPSNNWEFLVIAQHHGVPTRLLDWTYSPLVAAHFATLGGDPKADRVVYRFDWKQAHARFDLPDRALTVDDLDRVLAERGFHSIWEFFRAKQPELFVCMVEPPALDSRIVAQSATFTLCSDKLHSFDDILAAAGLSSALTRFIIRAAQVQLFRDQLDLCSIDEMRLFPDLQGVSSELRRYYSTSAAEAERIAELEALERSEDEGNE